MPIIVGDPADIHVQAVLEYLDNPPTVFDAATFLTAPVTIDSGGLQIAGNKVGHGRGWLRRLAPAGWSGTMNATDERAATFGAAMSALAAVARDARIDWLTPLDRLGGAENKPAQYTAAASAGVPVPAWIVTTDPDALPRGGTWVSKPLGPGSFIDGDGNGRIVPTARVDLGDPDRIVAVPFVLQELVEATRHARVVTVGQQTWSATMPARDVPLDWRLSPHAHQSFTATPVPEHIHHAAQTAARSNGVRYSAQDWICDANDDWWFIDLNPAGQWLFLPEPVAEPVTQAIAAFLQERT